MANKYGARTVELGGYTFASKKEAARYRDLCLLRAGGELRNLRVHPSWVLAVNGHRIGKYTADFAYEDTTTGATIVEDVKSRPTKTEAYRLRKRLMLALHGIEVVEIG